MAKLVRSVQGNIWSRSFFCFCMDLGHHRVFKRDREPSRIPVRILKRLRNKSTKLKEFVYKRIRPSIPKSSELHCYVKVRKLPCKLNTKRISLIQITHKNKLLLNCSSRVYQGTIRLKYRASRYLSLFSCNRLMCLYKTHTHMSNYCKFKLSTDREEPWSYSNVH